MVEEFINKVCSKIRDNRYYYSMNRENEFAVDCSWLLITSLKEVGVDVHGATYTGDMEKLTASGFKRIIIKPGTIFQRGDILVKHIEGQTDTPFYILVIIKSRKHATRRTVFVSRHIIRTGINTFCALIRKKLRPP